MKKNSLLKIVNIILGFSFVALIMTIILKDLMTMKTYGTVHPISGYLFILTAIIHIILNRNWIKKAFISKKED